MRTRGEMNVRLIAGGVAAIAAALAFGFQTPSAGPDWVGIIMGIAGLASIIAGVIPGFRSGTSRTS